MTQFVLLAIRLDRTACYWKQEEAGAGLELWKRSELASQIRLPEAPVRWRDVHRGDGEAVAGGDAEREGLAVEVAAALPVLAPVAAHRLPPGS